MSVGKLQKSIMIVVDLFTNSKSRSVITITYRFLKFREHITLKFTTAAAYKLVRKTGRICQQHIREPPPRKLLRALCCDRSRPRGGQKKSTRKNYLDLLNNLDDSDTILGRNHGELSCIFALITGDTLVTMLNFYLRADC